jgi:hypothetical protein
MDNPKHERAIADGKPPMHLIPWGILEDVSRVLAHGAGKYGERNWREQPIRISTYEGALARHIFLQWLQGEDLDADSGEHHLAHAIACLMVVYDAYKNGTLIDDRDRKEVINEEG